MLYCLDCGAVFAEENAGTFLEHHGALGAERWQCCPECRSTEIVSAACCQHCGTYVPEDDICFIPASRFSSEDQFTGEPDSDGDVRVCPDCCDAFDGPLPELLDDLAREIDQDY